MRVEDAAVVWVMRNAHTPPQALLDHPDVQGLDPYVFAAAVAKLLREKAADYQRFADGRR